MANRHNQSPNKGHEVIEKYIKESGEDFTGNVRGNVNWATSEEVNSLKRPTQQDYFDAIHQRQTSPISEETIVVSKEQKALNLIFRNGLNIRDMGNPMFGEEEKTNKKNFGHNITRADTQSNKVCVIYGGDLLGQEWELSNLNNAKIIEQEIPVSAEPSLEGLLDFESSSGEKQESESIRIKKALFFALGERVKVLKRDLAFALRFPDVDIYLVNGAQEEKINKYFKIDVLETIVSTINNPRLHYIRGINTIINVEKKHENGESTFGTIGLLTNNSLSKSMKGQAAKNAVRMNSGENLADVVFVTNTNVAGKKGPKDYYVSSESTFVETPKKKKPSERPRNYNTFSLRMPANREFTVVEGNIPQVNPLEMIVYSESVKNKVLKDVLLERIEQKIAKNTMYQSTDLVKRANIYASRNGIHPTINEEEKDEKSMSDL